MRERALLLGLGASLVAHSAFFLLNFPAAPDARSAPPIAGRLVEPPLEPLPAAIPVPHRPVRKVVAPVVPPSTTPEMPEATTEGHYRFLLAAAAARYNAYPARAEGAQGDVLVRIAVDASGSVSAVSLARSSDHPALDEQALETFRRASREVPVPRALWGRPFEVELRTTYRSG